MKRRRSRKRPWLSRDDFGGAKVNVASAVFELPKAGRVRTIITALALCCLGAAGLGAALAATPSPTLPREPAPARSMTVELFAPPPPAPPLPEAPQPAPPAVAPRPRANARSRPAAAPQAPAPAPARAAAVVTQEAPAQKVLDLSAFTIASGETTQAVGGATAGAGRGTQPVTGPATIGGVVGGTGTGTRDLSQPVRLPAGEWDCPWPAEADALGIDEQAVILHVTVRPDGRVESSELRADPGSGFGQAALACAQKARFLPATDVNGQPVRARSGPIRVLFIR